jgi:hypothetical protein
MVLHGMLLHFLLIQCHTLSFGMNPGMNTVAYDYGDTAGDTPFLPKSKYRHSAVSL